MFSLVRCVRRVLPRFALLFPLFLYSLHATAQAASAPAAGSPAARSTAGLTLPAGTKISLLLVRPVWAGKAKAGDSLYFQTNFPVTAGSTVAIPAGSYVLGRILAITPPTRKVSHANVRILFEQVILANGYARMLTPTGRASVDATAQKTAAAAQTATASMLNSLGTMTDVGIKVTTANDLLLDNGAQMEIELAYPMRLNAARVAQAIPLSNPPAPGSLHSATLCVPDPGTSDTVIPGSPGTPDTVIPSGIDGVPDTVIPGTPATPDNVIPGTPATVCPGPPMVVSTTLVAPATPSTPGTPQK
jgi:hypothetical protein